MKEAVQQKKVAYKKIGKNRSDENKAKYKNIKNRTKWLLILCGKKLKKS